MILASCYNARIRPVYGPRKGAKATIVMVGVSCRIHSALRPVLEELAKRKSKGPSEYLTLIVEAHLRRQGRKLGMDIVRKPRVRHGG